MENMSITVTASQHCTSSLGTQRPVDAEVTAADYREAAVTTLPYINIESEAL